MFEGIARLIHDNHNDCMNVDRATREIHRSRILTAASELFRARGVDGVSLAEVSSAAGLTHGAFYGHFASKASLAQAACRSAADEAVLRWRGRAEDARACGEDPLTAIIDRYLTLAHCDDAGGGCALAALGADAGRTDAAAIAGPLVEMANALVGVLADELAARNPARALEDCLTAARGAIVAMQGGLIMARTMRHGARGELAALEILAAARMTARRALD